MTDMAGALDRYAARFHARVGTGHHVASPLGAWLLLALCGPASHGPTRDQLTDVLGCDIDTAAAAAGELLNPPHAHVASAAAVWNRPQATSDEFAQWTGLPAAVTTRDLESQDQLDTWAKEHTLGLIDTFPIELSPETLLVLATALATRVSWEEPFAVVPAPAWERPAPGPTSCTACSTRPVGTAMPRPSSPPSKPATSRSTPPRPVTACRRRRDAALALRSAPRRRIAVDTHRASHPHLDAGRPQGAARRHPARLVDALRA